MRCSICGRPEEEVRLFSGIYEDRIGRVCESCAEKENIPLLKKPTEEQLIYADHRYSVRERMERISGMSHANSSDLSKDHLVAQKNLNKLRILPKKQSNNKLYDNYYWRLTLARRRRKLTPQQLAKISGVSEEIIFSIEKGILPANFEEPIVKLEMALDVNLLKDHETRVKFTKNPNAEREILRAVGDKMGVKQTFHNRSLEEEYEEKLDIKEPEGITESAETVEEKQKKLKQISRGNLDFSKRDNLQDISLSDLVEMKRKREKKQQEVELKKQNEAMFGEDLDLDEV